MRNKLICGCLLLLSAASCIQACKNERQIAYEQYFTGGKQLYGRYCQNCHNTDGAGLGSLYPPLTDTIFLRNNKERIACIIKHGMSGKITVAGKTYDELMPGNDRLSPIEVAQIVVYITNSFGNGQGMYDVNDATEDLKGCR